MAGIKLSEQIDGVSFIPLLEGKNENIDRPLFWHPPNYWGVVCVGYGSSSAVRLGDWKYIFYHDPGLETREELFNIRKDIGETKNLALINVKKRGEMRKILNDYLQKVDAQMPTDKKTNELIALPNN